MALARIGAPRRRRLPGRPPRRSAVRGRSPWSYSYTEPMASARQIHVGGVPIGGGAPVAVQTMTKTETANLHGDDGPDPPRRRRRGRHRARRGAARPGRRGAEDDRRRVADPDHRRHPLQPHAGDQGDRGRRALRADQPRQHRRAGQGRPRSSPRPRPRGTPIRVGVNSGSLPKHLRDLEFTNPVEALVTAATEWVELMHRLDFYDFKVSMKSTSVPNTIASNRLLAEKIDHPLHLGVTEAGTKWSGSLKSAVGLGTLLADGIGDTIRISLSTFHAEEEVKVAWEILKALEAARARPGADRLPDVRAPAVRHGLGRHGGRAAPGGLRGPDRGLDPRLRGQRHRRGPPRGLRHHRRQGQRDDLLQGRAAEEGARPSTSSTSCSPRSTSTTSRARRSSSTTRAAAEAAQWLAENEDETAMTPERLAAMEAAAAEDDDGPRLDEADSPVAGRRFTRAGRRLPERDRGADVPPVIGTVLTGTGLDGRPGRRAPGTRRGAPRADRRAAAHRRARRRRRLSAPGAATLVALGSGRAPADVLRSGRRTRDVGARCACAQTAAVAAA